MFEPSAVMRKVAERLGNTPQVARQAYVCPEVADEYLEGPEARAIPAAAPAQMRNLRARRRGRSHG